MKRITSFSIIIAIALIFIFSDSFADKRMVLMEEFTNASCGPCASQNPSFEEYISQNLTDIIPIVFHPNFPGSDLMYNFAPAMEEGRLAYYGVNGVPTALTNGKKHTPSSGWYDGAPGDISGLTNEVNKFVGTQSPITITPTYTITGNTMSLNVSVNSTTALSGKILRIAVVESYHYYDKAGTNGEKHFYYVVRHMLPDYNGQTINLSAEETKEFSYPVDINTSLNKQFLYVVAFVQDDATKEVLQANSSEIPIVKKIGVNLTVDASQLNGFVESGVAQSRKVTIQNPNNKEIKVGLTVNSAGFPKDWTVTLDKSEVIIPSQGSVDINANITAGPTTRYSTIQVDATPIGLTGTEIPEIKSGIVYALSKSAKYICFYSPLTTQHITYYASIYLGNAKYKNAIAFVVATDQNFVQAYPLINFDVLIYGFDYLAVASNGGILGNRFIESNTIRTNIQNSLTAGKNVLIIAEFELAITMGSPTYTDGQAFFKNDLGVGCTQSLLRVTTNAQNQITGLIPYTVQGAVNDPISNGLSFTCNNHANKNTYYTIYTDLIKLETNSKAVPFLFYDNDQTKIGGVHLENANKGKLVYMSAPMAGFSLTDGDNLYTKIMDWFLGSSVKAPQISASLSTISFNQVDLNVSDSRDVEISNTGDQDLLFTSIAIEGDAAGVYSITAGSNLTKLAAGTKSTVTVKFTPTQAKSYGATLRLQSNSTTNNDLKISVVGQGKVSSVDEELFSRFMQVSVGPNPVKAISTVSYTLNQTSQNVTMKLMDQTGRIVTELVNSNIAAGTYSAQLNAANYSAGVYYLVSSVNGATNQIPVVIIK
jgi:hypothetical protein